MTQYEVIVANVGCVHRSRSRATARIEYEDWCNKSKKGVGNAAGEDVSLFAGGEVLEQFRGSTVTNADALDEIQLLLDKKAWSADTLEAVALVVMRTGRNVRPPH